MRSRFTLTALLATLVAVVLTACSTGSGGGSDLESVKQAGVLRVATEGTYSPFSFHDPKTNALTGYDVEVAKAVADKLGVKVEYVETPWDAIFAGLAADRYDVVVNQVTKNPERAGLYGLSSDLHVVRGRHRHPRRRRDDLLAHEPRGQEVGAEPDEQLGQGRQGCRRPGRVGRGIHPGHHAAQAVACRRDRQRQPRGPRLPEVDGRHDGEDRGQDR